MKTKVICLFHGIEISDYFREKSVELLRHAPLFNQEKFESEFDLYYGKIEYIFVQNVESIRHFLEEKEIHYYSVFPNKVEKEKFLMSFDNETFEKKIYDTHWYMIIDQILIDNGPHNTQIILNIPYLNLLDLTCIM